MVKDIIVVVTALGVGAIVAVFVWTGVPALARDHTKIYKKTPPLLIVIAVALLGASVIGLLLTGSLNTDFHMNLK